MPIFIKLLKDGHIDEPDIKVLEKIRSTYAAQLFASIDRVTSALDLYYTVKAFPSTITKAIVLNQSGIRVNGPLSLENSKLLTANDNTGRQLVVKLLFTDNDDVRPLTVRNAEIAKEVTFCQFFATNPHHALVPCEVVRVEVPHEFVEQSRRSGEFTALVMPYYIRSLASGPTFSQTVVAREGSRMVEALMHIHSHGYVHMDVKGDNIFTDVDGNWFLGDFGSACPLGTNVRTTTEVFYPSLIVGMEALPKYDWFMLLVTLLIELDDKVGWALKLIAPGQHQVDSDLVMGEGRRVAGNESYLPKVQTLIAEIAAMSL